MNITVAIPDDVAVRLTAAAGDLERRVLEALAANEYRAGRLTKSDVRRLLGFETSCELDGFLKAHGVDDRIAVAELNRPMQDSDRQVAADDLVARFRAFAANHTLGGLAIKDLISEVRR